MYHYTAFGLQIASEPELPGLMPGNGNQDVVIRYGDVPEHLTEPLKGKGASYEINAGSFLLRIPEVARFLVNHGIEILIDKIVDVTDPDLSLFTINTPIGVLLYQRGYLPMHASAVVIHDGCVLFTGVSGVGKSTILASFHQHGYHILADEICAISLSGTAVPIVYPGVPYTWLWRDVLDYLGKDVSSLKHRVNNPEKYKVPVDERFYHTPLPLKRIYVLTTKNTPGIEIEEITGKEKFLPVKLNSYRQRIGEVITNPAASFNMQASIGKHAIVRRISRPEGKIHINALRELILKDMISC